MFSPEDHLRHHQTTKQGARMRLSSGIFSSDKADIGELLLQTKDVHFWIFKHFSVAEYLVDIFLNI